MTTITIHKKQYEVDSLSADAKEQLAGIKFINSELARLQAKQQHSKPPALVIPKPCKLLKWHDQTLMPSIEEDFWAELAQIEAESIGWIALDESAYIHLDFYESIDNTVM